MVSSASIMPGVEVVVDKGFWKIRFRRRYTLKQKETNWWKQIETF